MLLRFWLFGGGGFCRGGGGLVTALLRSPLPWMLGAMAASLVFALVVSPPPVCKSRPTMPPVARRLALVIIGVYLGGRLRRRG